MGGGLLFLDQDVIGTRWMWAGLGLHEGHTLPAPGAAEQSKALVQRKMPSDCSGCSCYIQPGFVVCFRAHLSFFGVISKTLGM